MGLSDWLSRLFARPREQAPPLSADEEEARRQADLLERNFNERGPGRWRKVGTLRKRD